MGTSRQCGAITVGLPLAALLLAIGCESGADDGTGELGIVGPETTPAGRVQPAPSPDAPPTAGVQADGEPPISNDVPAFSAGGTDAQAGPRAEPAGVDVPAPAPRPAATESDAHGDFCAVSEMLRQRCNMCHGATPAFGAPISLVSHSDLMSTATSSGRPGYELALERVRDERRPMPPAPNAPLSEGEIATLSAWVSAGAPAADGCATSATDSKPAPAFDPDCIDCGDYSCEDGTPVRFLAHGAPTPDDDTPYDASQIGGVQTLGDPNSYQCFYFKAPWVQGDQAIAFRPVIDNQRIMHHWLMYASENAPFDITDGGIRGECQLQGDPNRILIGGWAPGTPGSTYEPGVGQELPSGPNTYVTLEIHYYNTMTGQPAPDRSGAELCIANEPRPNVATQHWLGTENIAVNPGQRADASDTCTPSMAAGQSSTLLAVTPHMHEIGAHAKLEVLRAGGQVEVLHDSSFTFDNQTTYDFDPPVVVNSGDRLRATCTFENDTAAFVPYGDGTNEEMCYLFVTAYPAGSLHNGKTGCFGPFCGPGGKRRCIDNEQLDHIVTAL